MLVTGALLILSAAPAPVGLTEQIAQQTVKDAYPQLSECLRLVPFESGEVTFRITVSAEGTVSSAEAGGSTIAAAVTDCLQHGLLGLRFDKPTGGAPLAFTHVVRVAPGAAPAPQPPTSEDI